jgi:hypothetical protein
MCSLLSVWSSILTPPRAVLCTPLAWCVNINSFHCGVISDWNRICWESSYLWQFLKCTYEGVSKRFRTGRRERELQMVRLSATRCSCIAILWVSLMSFASVTLWVASQRVFIVVSAYFVIDSVRKLLDTPSYTLHYTCWTRGHSTHRMLYRTEPKGKIRM